MKSTKKTYTIAISGRGAEVCCYKLTPETKKELSYDEICDKIVDNFDDIRAVDHYMQLLKKMGKEKEFLNSEKGKHFIEMRKNMR